MIPQTSDQPQHIAPINHVMEDVGTERRRERERGRGSKKKCQRQRNVFARKTLDLSHTQVHTIDYGMIHRFPHVRHSSSTRGWPGESHRKSTFHLRLFVQFTQNVDVFLPKQL